MTLRFTKDEKFMLCLYEAAAKTEDIYCPVNRYDVGKMCGLAAKAVDTICVLLAQANFIKKVGPSEIRLTPHGESLVKRLQE